MSPNYRFFAFIFVGEQTISLRNFTALKLPPSFQTTIPPTHPAVESNPMTPQAYPLPGSPPPPVAAGETLDEDAFEVPRLHRLWLDRAERLGTSFLARRADAHGLQSRWSESGRAAVGIDLPRPETLTSALALKWLPDIAPTTRRLLMEWLRDKRSPHAPRFHVFDTPAALAPDVGTTGVALVALWRTGAIGVETLRRGAEEILLAAAAEPVQGVPEGVFKVFWEDHDEGVVCRRGREADPLTVVNALHAVVLAVRHARLDLEDVVDVREFREDGSRTRRMFVVAEIIQRNLDYICRHLQNPDLLRSGRYSQSEAQFLAFVTELWRDATPLAATLRRSLERAVRRMWSATKTFEGLEPLELASRIIAAHDLALLDLDLGHAREELCRHQQPDGSWAPSPFLTVDGGLTLGGREMATVYALRALRGPRRTGGHWHRRP